MQNTATRKIPISGDIREISIDVIQPRRQRLIITPTKLLREVPGKRQVYEALWCNREIIVKIFQSKIGAKRRLQREWKGLWELINRKIDVPPPLFYGITSEGQWVIASEKLPEALTATKIYQDDIPQQERQLLLKVLVRKLAQLNEAGIIQNDPNMGNFLVSDGKIYILDTGQVKFYRGPLSKNKSLKQLAMFLCTFDEPQHYIKELCEEYAAERNLSFNQQDRDNFAKYMECYFAIALRRALKKTLRTGKRHLKIKSKNYRMVLDKNFAADIEPLKFAAELDRLMDEGQILKAGNTCYVSRVDFADRAIVIKRYNHKGMGHSIRISLKGSRARHCWLYGYRLRMLGLNTAKPLAFVEYKKGPIIWKSYIITEYIEGEKLSDIIKSSDTDKQKQSLELVKDLISRMHRENITHGDLKSSNIIIKDKKAFITDLDGTKKHRIGWLFKSRCEKDRMSLEKLDIK